MPPLPKLPVTDILPALAQATATRVGAVVAVAPPYEPFGPTLQARGLAADRLCMVRAGVAAASALWAAEQALRCRDVVAVMAWLPQVLPAALRRLQLAAAQQQQLLWVFRPVDVAPQASPALLRLKVQAQAPMPGEAGQGVSVVPGMAVEILKRRGPPMVHALGLPGCHPRLAQALAAKVMAKARARQVGRMVGPGRNGGLCRLRMTIRHGDVQTPPQGRADFSVPARAADAARRAGVRRSGGAWARPGAYERHLDSGLRP